MEVHKLLHLTDALDTARIQSQFGVLLQTTYLPEFMDKNGTLYRDSLTLLGHFAPSRKNRLTKVKHKLQRRYRRDCKHNDWN